MFFRYTCIIVILIRPITEIIPSGNSEDWTESSHSNSVEPNYDIVFNQSEVLEFNITINSANWQIMQDDLEENLSSGTNNARNSPIDDTSTSDYEPIWVPSSVTFNGISWDNVGIRFKGNSSLTSSVRSGDNKLSFKLDFDEFEDEYPEIDDQRFYGFKQLNLNNNFSDESFMREKVAADLFREFGLVAAKTSFCVVNVDYGEGSQFFGLYTLVEEMAESTTSSSQSFDLTVEYLKTHVVQRNTAVENYLKN